MSSGTQTSDKAGKAAKGKSQTPGKPLFTRWQIRLIWFAVLCAGWMLVLSKNQWDLQVRGFYFGTPVMLGLIAIGAILGFAFFAWDRGPLKDSLGPTLRLLPLPRVALTRLQVWVLRAVTVFSCWLILLNLTTDWVVDIYLFVSPGAIFMSIGWFAVTFTALFLWRSGMDAATEGESSVEDYWRPIGRRHELEVEKRTLLKAIKEIEFDHNLGKMSDADASSLTKVYRQRAIAVIKAIDELGDTEAASAGVRDKIERDVKARLELARASKKKKKSKKKKGGKAQEATS